MRKRRLLAPAMLLFAAGIDTGCGSNPASSDIPPKKQPVSQTCDCTEYPFKAACDSVCGVTSAVVESVNADSVTVKVPAKGGNQAFVERVIPAGQLKAGQVEALKPGSHVLLTFRNSESGEPAIRSIRPTKQATEK